MLNIPDPWVSAAMLLSIASALLCVGWGILRWRDDEQAPNEDANLERWAREENNVEKDL